MAADTADTKEAFALFAIAQLQTGGAMCVAHTDVVVVADAVVIGVLVTYRDKPGTGEVVFHQAHNPVATASVTNVSVEFAVAAHPFGFEAKNILLVHFPCKVGHDDVVVVEVAGMSFYDGVEDVVGVGAGEYGVCAKFLGSV